MQYNDSFVTHYIDCLTFCRCFTRREKFLFNHVVCYIVMCEGEKKREKGTIGRIWLMKRKEKKRKIDRLMKTNIMFNGIFISFSMTYKSKKEETLSRHTQKLLIFI